MCNRVIFVRQALWWALDWMLYPLHRFGVDRWMLYARAALKGGSNEGC